MGRESLVSRRLLALLAVMATVVVGRVAAAESGTPNVVTPPGISVTLASNPEYLVVDPVLQHIFVSEPRANQIAVYSYTGLPIAAIPNQPGVSGLTVSGSSLYAADSDAG